MSGSRMASAEAEPEAARAAVLPGSLRERLDPDRLLSNLAFGQERVDRLTGLRASPATGSSGSSQRAGGA